MSLASAVPGGDTAAIAVLSWTWAAVAVEAAQQVPSSWPPLVAVTAGPVDPRFSRACAS